MKQQQNDEMGEKKTKWNGRIKKKKNEEQQKKNTWKILISIYHTNRNLWFEIDLPLLHC